MKNCVIFSMLAVVGVFIFSGCGSPVASGANPSISGLNNAAVMSENVQAAEKIEVVHFHATQQCWSCTTVGELALRTIKERFPEEYKNGIVVFKDVNGELPANRELVLKYQAGGSSLFTNVIMGGKDNIQEDVNVWRYVSNEQQFMNYFEAKLKKLLGK